MFWRLNKSFTSFLGVDLLSFIKNIEGLRLWYKITPFLVITKIENTEEYQSLIERFEDNFKYFYAVGAKTFFTKNTVGDEENFYSHCFRYYLPVIARQTFSVHGVDLGDFTMQGFERRNKEIKNIFKSFNNGKGNILLQNIKRLSDVFVNNANNY